MASINSLSGGSSTSSIYGNANILSGLASGMDTEAMIENAVSGIQNKITGLQQDRTMLEWEQEAYRSIIDKMVNFANKYTSYSSSTNLLSEAFFRTALSVSSSGVNADKVSASGRATSDVKILGVQQLATAATYKVSGLGGTTTGTITGKSGFVLKPADENDTAGQKILGTLDGSMTLKFGTTSVTLRFDEDDVYNSVDELVAGINEKLKGTDLEGKFSAVKDEEGGFKFEIDREQLRDGNNVLTLTSVSGNLKEKLDVSADKEANVHGVKNDVAEKFTEPKSYLELLETETIAFSLDGKTKSIKFTKEELEKLTDDAADVSDGKTALQKFRDLLQDKLNEAFGTYKDANSVEQANISVNLDAGAGALSFSVKTASTLSIEGGDIIGLQSGFESSYTSVGKTLDELIDLTPLTKFESNKPEDADKVGKYEFKINGEPIGYFSKDSTLQDVMNAINNNSESPVTVSFSKLSNKFVFTAKDTGAAGNIDFGAADSLAGKLFGVVDVADTEKYTAGKDAVFSMTVDGEVFDGITRSSNSFEVDGMTIKLEGTFGTFEADHTMGLRDAANGNKVIQSKVDAAMADAVSFTAKTDSDKIVEAIKEMVKDYNEMANEIKDAYSTMPLYNSKGKRYEPLTEDDEKDMSDSAVERYNEKAKTGILFGDSVLSGLYDEIRSAINELGMSNIGITTAFSDGKTTLVVDETKLKETLNNNPEKITETFTKSRSNGSSSDGFMTKLKNITDTYTKTTGTKGILIDLVGSTKSPLSLLNNTYQSKMDKLDETISRWQDKLSDKIDYYNRQFTRLEQMISQMNSQSSSLMGLMGY